MAVREIHMDAQGYAREAAVAKERVRQLEDELELADCKVQELERTIRQLEVRLSDMEANIA